MFLRNVLSEQQVKKQKTKNSQALKVMRQFSQKVWLKILTLYFFYSTLYLNFLKPCYENIFNIVCRVSEKIGI